MRRGGGKEIPQFPTHLFSATGKAHWAIQHVENAIAHYVTLRVRFSKPMAPSEAYELLAAEQRRTFGELLKIAKKHQLFSKKMEAELETLRKDRNWLAHQSMAASPGLMDPQYAADVDERVASIGRRALALQKEIGVMIEQFTLSHGVSPEVIEAEVRRRAPWFPW